MDSIVTISKHNEKDDDCQGPLEKNTKGDQSNKDINQCRDDIK